MGRHVVGTFVDVAVEGISIRNQPIEERIQIAPHVGVGIFLNDERRRGVMDEDVSESGDGARVGHDGADFGRDVMKAAAVSLDSKAELIHAVYLLPP